MGIQSKCTVFMFHQKNEWSCWDSDGRGKGHKWRTNGAHFDGAVLLWKEGLSSLLFQSTFQDFMGVSCKAFSDMCMPHGKDYLAILCFSSCSSNRWILTARQHMILVP